MRNLTIRREKAFAGSLAKLKVYVADPVNGDLEIDGTLCRKLGVLKNGKEAVFQISKGKTDVYVISDKLSRSFYFEKRTLEAGEEDVYLSGKVHYKPFAGNPFRFDGEVSEEVEQKRRATGKKSGVILIVSIILGCVMGWYIGASVVRSPSNDPKMFTVENMSIVLTEQFRKTSVDGYTGAWQTSEVMVLALQEKFSLMPGVEQYSVEEYANLVKQANGQDEADLQRSGGLIWFEYDWTNPDLNKTYHYFVYLYKSRDAFWLVQFATFAEDAAGYADQIAQWAETVSFSIKLD